MTSNLHGGLRDESRWFSIACRHLGFNSFDHYMRQGNGSLSGYGIKVLGVAYVLDNLVGPLIPFIWCKVSWGLQTLG
jgi:hypothetical protein